MEDEASKNELAKKRTELAVQRTILANARTFSAWIRTGAIISIRRLSGR